VHAEPHPSTTPTPSAGRPEGTTADLPPGLPIDWVFEADLPCPACRYNLRMLRTPRCPECGVRFRWQALLPIACPRCGESLAAYDGSQCPRCALELHWPALLGAADVNLRANYFEYSDRPIRATLRSFWAALRPVRFWKTVPLESPPAVPRLRVVRHALFAPILSGTTRPTPWYRMIYAVGSVPDSAVDLLVGGARDYLPLVAIVAVPALTTLVGLPLFVPTLARFQVRREQLLRCLTIELAGALWSAALVLIALLIASAYNVSQQYLGAAKAENRMWFSTDVLLQSVVYGIRSFGGRGVWATGEALALNGVLFTSLAFLSGVWQPWNTWVCLTRYLRLDRANALALWVSIQLITLLILLIVCVTALAGTSSLNRIFRAIGWL